MTDKTTGNFQEELGDTLSSGTDEDGEMFQDARDKVSPCSSSSDTEWRDQDKHLFVLSEAGKPIYTLHGDEDIMVSLFGVMQVIFSKVFRLSYSTSLGTVT